MTNNNAHIPIRLRPAMFIVVMILIAFSSLIFNNANATTVTFNNSASWTAPAGVTSITVEAWGGGGGGGGATNNPAKGGGGAGGQYASKVVTVTPGNIYPIAVGGGGVGSTGNGLAGGDSTFATNAVVAKGGAGGAGASTANGAGGVGSSAGGVGTTVFAGGSGSNGVGATGVGGAGGGGAGSTGAGGDASGNAAGAGTAAGGGAGAAAITSRGDCGNAASAAGGGGCAGYATNSTDRSGGNGAGGKVTITYVPPSATTVAATAVAAAGATVNGTVSSNGASTTVTFDYGLTAAYGSSASASQSPLAAGASGAAVSANLTGLACGTLYHFRVNASNSGGITNGSDLTFTTSSCPAVTSINRASTNPTAPGATISWTVVFNRSVSGVDVTDFALVLAGGVAGATITSVTGAGTTWTVNANTGSYGGTIGLNLVDDDTIIDAGGISLGGAGAGNGNFTGQVYTDTAPFCSPPSNTPAGVSLTCVCDTFARGTLNPSPIFNSDWIATTSDATGIVPSIVNSGYLRLTNKTGNNAKSATVPGIFPATGNYISVEFQQFAYGSSTSPNGADGIAVTLSDYAISAAPGAFGGSLGYAQKTGAACGAPSCPGFAGGWIGVALDEFGNYQNPSEGRIGGPGSVPESVGIRGSGSVVSGYNWLAGTSTLAPKIDNPSSAAASLGYYYQVIVDARNDASGTTAVTVNRDTGAGYSSLISIPNVYTAATAQGFTQSPVPNNWQISFTGSTGGSTNIHEISGLRICAQTVAPPNGGTAGGFNAIDEAYGLPPAVVVQNYLTGHIYTKLVGTPFKLNVAALNNSQILTTYAASANQSVTVKLVNNSDGACVLDSTKPNYCSNTCTSKAAVTGGSQTLTFVSGATDKGQKQSADFTLNSAYSNLVAIISDGTTTACSTDAFSVRPTGVASVTSTAASNVGAAAVKVDTGNFDLVATTIGVNGFPGGYTGNLKINSAQVKPVLPILIGTLSPLNFPAAVSNTSSSTATGNTFHYSELGAFNIFGYDPASDISTPRGVYDGVATATECAAPVTAAQCDTLKAATWTGVDSVSSKGDCIIDSYSNTKVNGKYGCNFGNVSTATFGRFTPEHFNTSITSITACPTGLACPDATKNFAYSGQTFTTTVSARNGSDVIMSNYDSGKGFSKLVRLSAWDAAGSVTTANPSAGTLGGTSIAAGAFANGVATTATSVYTLPTPYPALTPTSPTDIYLRAVDTDSVTSLRGASSIEGGIKIVSGRILVPNAYGSELLKLPIGVLVQYWNGTQSVTSDNDNTTTFAATNVSFSSCTKNLTGAPCKPIVAVDTPPATISIGSGNGKFKLKAPAADGSADLTINGPAYLPSTTGRVTFGVYKAGPVIYLRELY